MTALQEVWERDLSYRKDVKPQLDSNKVWIEGTVIKSIPYSRKAANGGNFHTIEVSIERKSGKMDNVYAYVFDDVLKDVTISDICGKRVQILGRIVCRKAEKILEDGVVKHIAMYILAQYLEIVEEIKEDVNNNMVYLCGEIAKEPIYRVTLGNWEITELVLKIQTNRKGDTVETYCISWANEAKYAKNLKVGEKVEIYGRIESRRYKKPMECVEHEINEISIRYIV